MFRILHDYRSIKGKIILFYFFYILLFFSIFLFGGYSVFSSILMNTIFTYTKKLVEETGRNIDSYLGQINMICSSAATSQVILSYLDTPVNSRAASDNLWEVEYHLQDMVKFNSRIRDMILIGKGGHSISASGKGVVPSFNFYEQQWFPGLPDDRSITFTGMHQQNYYYENYGGSNETVSAVIPVHNFLNRELTYGASIVCNLNIFELFESLRNITLEKSGQIMLLDQNGRSLFRSNYSPAYLQEIESLMEKISRTDTPLFANLDGRKSAFVHTRSAISGWTIVAVIPREELISHITPLKYIFAIIFLFLLFMVNISYSFMNNLITRPIEKIIAAMQKIETGNFEIMVNEKDTIETELLSVKINSLVASVVELNRKIYSYQLQNKEAQIKALQAQINPHFLFNTLQLIKSSAVSEGNRETGQIITSLGNMLRYGIYHQEELVCIREELEHLNNYLGIQAKRFPSLFNCTIDCPEDLLGRQIIKLILQPVVENSIYHNKVSTERIDIKITIAETGGRISIWIEDNGAGVTAKRLEEIRNYIMDISLGEHGESIGLKNVHNRIFLKFGSPYGASAFSVPGEGFRIELLLPDIPCRETVS